MHPTSLSLPNPNLHTSRTSEESVKISSHLFLRTRTRSPGRCTSISYRNPPVAPSPDQKIHTCTAVRRSSPIAALTSLSLNAPHESQGCSSSPRLRCKHRPVTTASHCMSLPRFCTKAGRTRSDMTSDAHSTAYMRRRRLKHGAYTRLCM